MKIQHLIIPCVLSLLVFCLPAFAATIPYSTNFSTDPGWITDQPGNFYWNSANKTYYARTENLYPGYTPSRYSYELLPESVGSFKLQWDIQITQCDVSGGLSFGIYDNKLQTNPVGDTYLSGGQSIQAKLLITDFSEYGAGPGYGLSVYANGASGSGGEAYYNFINPLWNFNTWYTCYLNYDAATDIVDFAFNARGSSTSIWTYSFTMPGGGFTNDLRYLGISNSGVGDGGNYYGLSSSATAEGYIDNVVLTPEPVTLLLLGLGAAIAARRR
jgi:hypothetical protein